MNQNQLPAANAQQKPKSTKAFIARIATVLIAACALSTLANAQKNAETANPWLPTTVGVHLVSHHINGGTTPSGAKIHWNNENPGIYARWANGLTVGTLRNSLSNQSVYVGYTAETQAVQVLGQPLSLGITAGVISGYDRITEGPGDYTQRRCNAQGCRAVNLKRILSPMLVPSVAWQASQHAAARLSYIPRSGGDSAAALHLSVEWRF